MAPEIIMKPEYVGMRGGCLPWAGATHRVQKIAQDSLLTLANLFKGSTRVPRPWKSTQLFLNSLCRSMEAIDAIRSDDDKIPQYQQLIADAQNYIDTKRPERAGLFAPLINTLERRIDEINRARYLTPWVNEDLIYDKELRASIAEKIKVTAIDGSIKLVLDGDLDVTSDLLGLSSLPNRLWVKGDLNLKGSPINCLPSDLIVDGSANLSGCRAFKTISSSVRIGKDLDLSDSSIRTFPDNWNIPGSLNLSDCTGFKELPRMHVAGDLDLSGSWVEGFNSLNVLGDLLLKDCWRLNLSNHAFLNVKGSIHCEGSLDGEGHNSLPKKFSRLGPSNSPDHHRAQVLTDESWITISTLVNPFTGSAEPLYGNCKQKMFHYQPLIDWVNDLRTSYSELYDLNHHFLEQKYSELQQKMLDLWVMDCPEAEKEIRQEIAGRIRIDITQSPCFRIDGDLDIQDPLLTSLPNGLFVGGSLNLSGTSIAQLPSSLCVSANVNCSRCPNLITLPRDIFVRQDMDLSDSGIQRLPSNLHFRGSLNLSGCTEFSELPPIQVDGDLVLSGTAITTLVGGNLTIPRTSNVNLSHCLQLETITGSLVVNNLDLIDCSNFRLFPSFLTIRGDLIMRGCQAVQPIRDSYFMVYGTIDLHDSTFILPLDYQRLQDDPTHDDYRLARRAIPVWSNEELLSSSSSVTSENLTDLLGRLFPGETLERFESCSEGDRKIIQDYFFKLCSTPEYKQNKQFVEARLASVFRLANREANDFELLIWKFNDALTACTDRVITGMEGLELLAKIDEAKQSEAPESQLRALGIGTLREERLYKRAILDAAGRNRASEELEFYLYYLTKLQAEFNLPTSISEMVFTSYSGLTDANIEEARVALNSITDAEINTFLNKWDPWVEFQRSETAVPDYGSLRIYEGEESFEEDICVLSQYPFSELKNPVGLLKGDRWTIYEYSYLVSCWERTGTDPMPPQTPFELTDLVRIQKTDPPAAAEHGVAL